MKINLDDIPKEGLELTFSMEQDTLLRSLQPLPEPATTNIDARVSGQVRILRSGADVFFFGTVAGVFHLQCSRCLVDFDLVKEVSFNTIIRSRPSELLPKKEADEAQEDVFFIEGLEFDPADIIVQELILEIPMKPLCREECPGLCPRCGALKGSCSCSEEGSVDPRWDALARLKEKAPK
jgi:DUF177 domain-containing protein